MNVSEMKLDKYVLNDWYWGTKMQKIIHRAVYVKIVRF